MACFKFIFRIFPRRLIQKPSPISGLMIDLMHNFLVLGMRDGVIDAHP